MFTLTLYYIFSGYDDIISGLSTATAFMRVESHNKIR